MKKKIYIQILGVIACLAVVAMHVNGCFWQFSYDRYWITANIIESICYFAVPIFFMISGATLLNYRKRYTTAVFFRKRLGKTLVPFLIWSGISAVWYYAVYHTRPEGIREVIDGILNTRYVDIYWFFPALFSVYLCIPVLSCIPEQYRKRIFGYAIIVYVALEALAPLVCNLAHIEFNEGIGMPAVGGYLIYTLLGYWIDNYELPKRWRYVIYVAAAGGFLLMLFGTQILSLKNGVVDTTFKEYRNVPCILYSTGIFLFFRNMKQDGGVLRFLGKLTAPFSSLTFGIYLVHFYLVQMVAIYQIFPITSIKYRIFGTIVIFLISAVAVRILQMIPVVKKAIPS